MVLTQRVLSAIFLSIAFFPAALWADDTPPAQLFLAQVEGEVEVIHDGSSHQAQPPEPLSKSDEVKTGDDGMAYLEFQNGGVVEVGAHSDAKVSRLEIQGGDFKARFLLAWGRLKAKVKKLTTSSSAFEIEAGGVVTGVRGTVFGVEYDKDTKKVSAQTFEGSVFTRVGNKEQILDKGFAMAIEKTGVSVKSPLTGEQMNSFKDFTDVSGQLEKKKQELLQEMHQKVLDKLPGGILPQKQEDDLKNTIGQKLPF